MNNFGFFRVAAVSPMLKVADPQYNATQIIKKYKRRKRKRHVCNMLSGALYNGLHMR